MPTIYLTTPPTKSDPAGGSVSWTPCGDPHDPRAGVLRLKGKRNACAYVVVEFPTGWPGRGFHLSKLDAGTDKTQEAYSVFVGTNGQDRSCECAGFTYTGHCRHLDAVLRLIGEGQL